jgi:DNA-binding MarR family transcriptional regulator
MGETHRRQPPSARRDEIAAQLRVSIARTFRRLRQEAGSGLSASQTSALATAEQHGPLTPTELAAREHLARPGVTRVVARLESGGMIRREPDPADRRSYRITVTRRGVGHLAAVRTRSKAYLSRALRTLDDDDLATLERAASLLDRLFEEER